MLIGFFLLPFYWLVTTAFKKQVEAFSIPPKLVFLPILKNFFTVLDQGNFLFYLKNSLIICILSSLIATFLGAICAYGLARFTFKKKEDVAFWILSIRMFPPIASALPLFLLFSHLNLIDTHIGLILIYVTFGLPFSVWMLRGFFESIPSAIEESAMIEGCGYFSMFTRIALPLVAPGLSATIVINLIFMWNEFLFALIFTQRSSPTLPILASSYVRGIQGVAWTEMCATGTLIIIPMLVFGILSQKYLIRGLTMGAMKE